MDEVDLGKRLQTARKRAGLTQQELCHKAKLSYSTLAKIERGAIKSPSIFTIQSVAGALGASLSELMGDSKGAAKKRSKSGVRFVYFDINGCLVRFFHRAFAKIAADSGASADTIETTFWHYNDSVCRGELGLQEFNELFAKRLGVNKIDWNSYYLDAIEPITETGELVRWAAPQYHIGLLSNIMPGLVDELFARKILPDVTFDAIIDSSKVGAIKPESKIYEVAESWTDCKPEEILLVDDDRANLMAAERMGWHVLWFDDYRPEESVARVKDALEPE
jgi:FMN phosphatase YigB (HAD superfamily)